MRIRRPFIAACLGAVLLLAHPAWSDPPPASPAMMSIEALVEHGAATLPPSAAAEANLKRFYEARHFEPAWGDETRVAALAAVLAGTAEHGLDLAFPKAAWPAGGDSAARDVALTRLALSYAAALASGRVDFAQIEADWAIPAPAVDLAGGLAAALTKDLAAWYDGLAPHHAAYRRLVAALARYRVLAAGGGWAPVPRGEPLKLGMVAERVRALRRRLEAEGDLAPLPAPPTPVPPAAVAAATAPIQRIAIVSDEGPQPDGAAAGDDPETVYDEAVAAAVRRFQHRYGIAVDGAVGPRTLAALNVPARARVEQIALNLERWRALPREFGDSYMLVNVPAETLDVIAANAPVLSMKVVVGDPDHPTPVVRTAVAAVTLNPAWNIPASILTKEILPKSKRDRTYLLKNEIVFVPGHGWQQLPGPKNPLGQIKFETPNKFDVYLHDTPSRLAFDRFFRAQSHGCVRLEHAAELAGFVLRDIGWNDLQISQAAATGETRRIDLKHRWRVYLLYATSFVDEDGMVEFRDDLYGRDARLRDALAAAQLVQRQAGL
jgi:murein L,D-transpeptidase YcbB/YkuD